MIWLTYAAAVVPLVIIVVAWCVWTARRLDRLQLRCEITEAALRTQLARRSSIAMELATAGDTGRASAPSLFAAAAAARDAHCRPEWTAESRLSSVLQLAELPGPDGDLRVRLLLDAQRRASIARRIHNDGAAAALTLRHRRRVRWFRLARGSRPPAMIEFDDGQR